MILTVISRRYPDPRPDDPPPGRYHGDVDGRRIVTSARTPFYTAARVLLKEGVDPDTMFEMQHEGEKFISLRGRLAEMAKWTVREDDKHGPDLVPYREFPDLPRAEKQP